MIPVLSRAQMRAFDAHAIGPCRVPSLLLMENAGRGAADVIEREVMGGRARGHTVVVVCGTGNNGGDGFVVARQLLTRGARVTVWLAGDPARQSPDCRVNHDAFVGLGGKVEAAILGGSQEGLAIATTAADVVVDALFGTGLDRPITDPMASVVRVLQDARAAGRAQIAALDLPSGLDADTGVVVGGGAAVAADLTITFAHLKLGLVTGSGARLAGPVHVVDIGVPDVVPDRSAELVEAADVAARIGKRAIDAHKYRAGHVAIIGGSPGRVGAALLAARGALRGGAGAASIATWPAAAAALEGRVPELMVTRLPGLPHTPGGNWGEVDQVLAGKGAVVLGPGFGTDAEALAVAKYVLASFGGPIVADADAFSLFAGAPEALAAAGGRLVLTPHAGELARLLGYAKGADAIEHDRFAAVREAARKTQAVVLLKGPYTVVCSPDGRIVVSGTGVPALATAGSGDVLAGLIGALACHLAPFDAAWCGAFLHGVSGAAWQKEHGDRGLFAGEIADGLPAVLAALATS
jgi:NAD(P)H-hydrate epimerase